MRATAEELSVQILKCYGLENAGVGQIGILFKFYGGSNSAVAPGE